MISLSRICSYYILSSNVFEGHACRCKWQVLTQSKEYDKEWRNVVMHFPSGQFIGFAQIWKTVEYRNSRIAYTKSRTDITQKLVRVHDSSNHHIDSKSHPSNPARTTCSLINNLVNRRGDLTAGAGRGWFEMLTSSQPKCLDSTYSHIDIQILGGCWRHWNDRIGHLLQ